MQHVEYEEWTDLIKRITERFNMPRDLKILELGAGTGIVGAKLSEMGYLYTASDISFPMCKEARDLRGLTVCAADARHLPFKNQFDMALFLYDGINYLLTLSDYRKLFASVYNVLNPGGFFLFDITTRANSIKYFTNYLDYEDFDDLSYVRHSYFDAKESIQYNDFTIYYQSIKDPSLYEKYIETHTQKVFLVQDIEKTIPKKRFSVLGIWDGYTFRKYTAKSERVHFLLRKSGGA
jgi:SAM-dependent methyltransferase